MRIKSEPELRHVLAHLIEAIRDAADGRPHSSHHHLDSIEGLVLFEDEVDMEKTLMACTKNKKRPVRHPKPRK